jgi:dipeptide/tripeptide permease
MKIITDDFSMKVVAGFALFFIALGCGGLIGALIAYMTVPLGFNLDFNKTAAVGAVVGFVIAALAILYAVFSRTTYEQDDLNSDLDKIRTSAYRKNVDVFKD